MPTHSYKDTAGFPDLPITFMLLTQVMLHILKMGSFDTPEND